MGVEKIKFDCLIEPKLVILFLEILFAFMKILLTGITGQVGWELQRALMPLGEVIAPPRSVLDLSDPSSIVSCLRTVQPNVIVNPAAYTAVDKAESEPDLARQINALAPGILAEEAKKLDAWLLHYSTDYVFAGTATTPYQETDPTDPLGVYGKTKREGEINITLAGEKYWIFRTCWVYSLRGKNFLKTMLRLSRERQELKIVHDQWGTPTWSRLIAEVTAQLLPQRHQQGESGIYHLSASGATTWYEFTKAILAVDPSPQEQIVTKLMPITTAEYPTPAQRPAYSVLNCDRVQATFGIHLPDWRSVLSLVMS